jgi:hypothetical protein
VLVPVFFKAAFVMRQPEHAVPIFLLFAAKTVQVPRQLT